jgi:regulator of replication initiation timing
MNTPSNFNQPTPDFGNNPDNSKRLLTMAGIAIAVLLGLSIFLMVSKYKTGQELDTAKIEMNEQKQAFAELDTKYNDAVAQLEQQKGLNAQLDEKINQQLQQLEQNKSQIEQMIREKRDIKSAMARLENQKQQYLAEIDKLKADVGILTEKNTQLSTENQTLNTSLTETQTRLSEESTAKASLISEKTQLETERQVLSKKVDIASAIRVKNITVKAVDVRSSGKEKSKSRASKVDKLNICFVTEPNEVVPSGEETFYLTVIDPTGATLAVESLGSGIAQDKRNEQEFRYTTTATTNYQNGESNVCGAWQPGQNFVKGKYEVKIFNKGYLVGSGSFNLK